jgi:hypothetical protein
MHNSVIVRLQLRPHTVQKGLSSATADAKPSQCIICTNRAIIVQFTSAVTIISVFGWRYMPYCLCQQCNAIAMTHNGLHLASCNATYTILHLAQGSEATIVFYKHSVYN